ncbi:alpha/beta fold hydrolase [Vibrio sp. PP-XX7]
MAKMFRASAFCHGSIDLFTHAGGGASAYANWAKFLPESIEVWALQLPGREDQLAEPMIDRMPALVETVLPYLIQLTDKPFVLFGHSMGASLGYEICQALHRRQDPLPLHLIVSGREAPMRNRSDTIHLASDQALMDSLIDMEPAMADVLAHRDLADLCLPVIRNDYALINSYCPDPSDPPLPIRVTGLSGKDDEELLPGDMDAWSTTTGYAYQHYVFPGRHFYLREQRDAVIQVIQQIVADAMTEHQNILKVT